MKKTLKQFVYERLEKGESLTDSDVYKFRQKEQDIYTATDYMTSFNRLKGYRDYFNNYYGTDRKLIPISKLHNYNRKYFAQLQGFDFYIKICKDYFNEVLSSGDFVRDMSRPDLKNVFDYIRKC